MKRSLIAIFMVVTTGAALTAPAVAQASVRPAASAQEASHGAATGEAPAVPAPGTTQRRAALVTLSPAQCAALRRSPHSAGGSCTVIETLRLVARTSVTTPNEKAVGLRMASADSDTYVNGYLQACAAETGGSSGYACNTSKWWVDDYFAATYSGSQVWNNGTPHCGANHTSVTWCSYVGNGTSQLSEGFNFGSNGYARMDIQGNGECAVHTNSYSVPYGQVIDAGWPETCDYSAVVG